MKNFLLFSLLVLGLGMMSGAKADIPDGQYKLSAFECGGKPFGKAQGADFIRTRMFDFAGLLKVANGHYRLDLNIVTFGESSCPVSFKCKVPFESDVNFSDDSNGKFTSKDGLKVISGETTCDPNGGITPGFILKQVLLSSKIFGSKLDPAFTYEVNGDQVRITYKKDFDHMKDAICTLKKGEKSAFMPTYIYSKIN